MCLCVRRGACRSLHAVFSVSWCLMSSSCSAEETYLAFAVGTEAKGPLVLPRPAFDVSLRQTLLDPRNPLNAEKLGACFVYPPWGSFVGHISGTSGGMRDIHWDRPGIAPGTREVPHWPNTRERYLGKFCEQGVPPWSHAVVLPKDLGTHRWRTRPLATQTCGADAAFPKPSAPLKVPFIPTKK